MIWWRIDEVPPPPGEVLLYFPKQRDFTEQVILGCASWWSDTAVRRPTRWSWFNLSEEYHDAP